MESRTASLLASGGKRAACQADYEAGVSWPFEEIKVQCESRLSGRNRSADAGGKLQETAKAGLINPRKPAICGHGEVAEWSKALPC